MRCGAYLTGSFGQSQELYVARNEAKRGRGSYQSVVDQVKSDSEKVISLQKNAGMDLILDPMFPLFYLFQPFVDQVKGVERGPQENWFNNNMFYWRPQIHGPLEVQAGFTDKYLHVDALPEHKLVVLPSPYTLLMLSDVSGYSSQEEAVANLAEVLKAEAQHLVECGFECVQYDEPVLVVKQSLTENDWALFKKGMEICGSLEGARTSLHTYFGDAGPLIPSLLKIPVDCIGIDCTETRLDDILKYDFSEKELALGLLDARNTGLEDAEEIVEQVRMVARKTQPQKLWVTPNAGTEYRGFTHSTKKLALLGKVREMLHG